MSNFDPDAFMQQTVDDQMAAEPVLVPVGEYEAVISKLSAKEPKDNDSGINLIITWDIIDPQVKAQLDRPTVTVPQFMFCELDESGRIATGGDKNWRLGAVRKAVHQDGSGAWHIKMLEGAGPARIRVRHNTYEGNTNAQVDKVVALS